MYFLYGISQSSGHLPDHVRDSLLQSRKSKTTNTDPRQEINQNVNPTNFIEEIEPLLTWH